MRLISERVFGRCGIQAALGALLALLALQPLVAQNRGIIGLRQVALADAGAASRPVAGPVFAENARLANGLDRAELSFDLSAPVKAGSFVLAAPDRIVVELPQVEFEAAPPEGPHRARHPHAAARAPGGLVASYRFGLFAPGKSRIVIDLSAPARVLRAAAVSSPAGTRLVVSLARMDRAAFLAAAHNALAAQQAATADDPPAPGVVAAAVSGLPVVVIDPGHGGIDSGAMVRGLVEKNIVFDFAKELAGKLRASGHYKVVMTRDSDVFVALGDRVKIARDAGASLFVSVHADTISDAASVSGATVYTCSEHASDAEAARTAEKENQADAVAGVESKDEDNGVSDILFDLTRQETRTYSHVFARTLVNYWQVAARLNKNPERSAGFRVLKAPDVPSVLIELGYLSNAADGAALNSPGWRDATTSRVAAAIDAFFTAKGSLPAKANTAPPTAEALDTTPTGMVK
ncbi:MAG: N-acetylmuramoyl-L-alanine amidase [Methylovirgula sp.]|nr:N-acetylmuramoyl-L-alanine amidase [Methylovirgula sp.]